MKIEGILIIIVTICTYISYIPQIIKLIITKESEAISISSYMLWITASSLSMFYAVTLKDFYLLLAYFSELFMCIFIIVLSIKYKKPKERLLIEKNGGN